MPTIEPCTIGFYRNGTAIAPLFDLLWSVYDPDNTDYSMNTNRTGNYRTIGHQNIIYYLDASDKIDIMQIEFGETNIASRTFFRDIRKLLPNYELYRLLPNGLLKMDFANEYMHEFFAYQNLVAVRKGLQLV